MVLEYSRGPERIFSTHFIHICAFHTGQYFLITMVDVIFHLYMLEPNKTHQIEKENYYAKRVQLNAHFSGSVTHADDLQFCRQWECNEMQ